MPIGNGVKFAIGRMSCPRDSLTLSTIAPCLSRPIRWKTFLLMAMIEIVGVGKSTREAIGKEPRSPQTVAGDEACCVSWRAASSNSLFGQPRP